ncbi:DUF1015 domain-containing protein [Magnetofaba australis]|uniref:DUF1015 domain-containing protein n=1 Tax=Magnetofaba australis IT-1 TaxID=1434232 RepID=A0A1Y2K2S3_9PROT|nr:DUF1015 family protein [Magnetofaba australis]OSM02272.1 hypothetical protein MAIT1_02390 [Magnetofaba australis IT-1]
MSQHALVRPFPGWRPPSDQVEQISAPPYDVMNRAEAAQMAHQNARSFLHVSRADLAFDDEVPTADERVYLAAAENYARLKADGALAQDPTPCYYFYRLIMDGRAQTGLVAAASVIAYDGDRIKKHEFTRPDKENDRTEFAWRLKAHSGPVFLTYRNTPALSALLERGASGEPTYDFTAADGVQHTLWVVSDAELIDAVTDAFDALPHVYVADGHHRSAAASRCRERWINEHGEPEAEAPVNRFLSVLFPDDQMRILDYNRVVADLNGLSAEAFVTALETDFEVGAPQSEAISPSQPQSFGMYLNGQWRLLRLKPGVGALEDPVKRLDVSLLSDHLLGPILGITDPRRDKRIDFVGGIRGMAGLSRRVDSGEMTVAFSMYPTSMADLMAVADAGEVMPPKSTWFEPKLRDGLVIQSF